MNTIKSLIAVLVAFNSIVVGNVAAQDNVPPLSHQSESRLFGNNEEIPHNGGTSKDWKRGVEEQKLFDKKAALADKFSKRIDAYNAKRSNLELKTVTPEQAMMQYAKNGGKHLIHDDDYANLMKEIENEEKSPASSPVKRSSYSPEKGIYMQGSNYRILFVDQAFREPNDIKYVDYCGPSSTAIAISARLDN